MGVVGAAESTSLAALVVFGTATSLLAKISARRWPEPLPHRLPCSQLAARRMKPPRTL